MCDTLRDMCANFKYSSEERNEILESLTKHLGEDFLSDAESNPNRSPDLSMEEHIEEEIIDTLVSMARELLGERLKLILSKEVPLADFDKISRHARKLLYFLEEGGARPEGYWINYFGDILLNTDF